MQHGILGPGGVGGLVAAVLADAGEDVTLIVRSGTESLYPAEISLESTFRSVRAPVSVTSNPQQPLDFLWVAVKAKIRALPSGMRTSMERDIADGNAPELDAIAGPILRSAQSARITLSAIPELVQEIASVRAYP